MQFLAKLEDDINHAIFSALGREVMFWRPVKQGGNSSVYCLTCADNYQYALKLYPPLHVDPRQRRRVEFDALQFLRGLGETKVPAPLVELRHHNAAVFEWIEGESPRIYGSLQIDAALEFLRRLQQKTRHPEAAELPYASEAALSYAQVKGQIDERRQRLLERVQHEGARRFLLERYQPTEQRILARLDETMAEPDELTARERLTLSPSDFGFHNCIQHTGGGLVFVDFEYFGWDDPAKLIADFLWHPGMKLAGELKQRFVRGALAIYNDDELPARLQFMYAMCGLRWCLIMLNEFLPDGRAKRQHSGKLGATDEADVLAAQLHKAELTLLQLINDFQQFPYAK